MKLARIIDSTGREIIARAGASGDWEEMSGRDVLSPGTPTGKKVEPVRWLPPVEPRVILCVGLNYRQHAIESNLPIPEQPVLFMKNPAAATGHREKIVLPRVCEDEVDFECELALVIGRACRNASRGRALEFVAGYTAANDVSARIWQMKRGGSQWVRGKSFDTFAPLGPVFVTPDEVGDPGKLQIKTILNGKVVQDSSTSDLIFDLPTVIEFCSQDTTLLPGTVILTGTPSGIGWARDPKILLHAGDTVVVEVEKIGRLENSVVAAEKAER